jgi:hypothetical protein
MMQRSLDAATIRWLAVEASVDPKSIVKVARGEHVRGMAGRRATAALRAAGFLRDDAARDAARELDDRSNPARTPTKGGNERP